MERTELNELDMAKLCPLKIDDGGVVKDVDEYNGLYNVSQGKLASIVSKGYNVVQHKEYFSEFLKALDRFNLKYDANVINMGNKASFDIEFKDKNIKFTKLNEEFTTGIRLTNSYDKSTGLGIVPKYKRLACMNGMVLQSLGMTMVCKHNSLLSKDIEHFIKTRLSMIINQSKELQEMVSVSMKDSIEWKLATKIICHMFKLPKHREEILQRLDVAMIEKKNQGTYDAFKGEKKKFVFLHDDKKGKSKYTRWEIYNAITNYLSVADLSGQLEMWLQKKAEKVLITKLNMMPLAEIEV